MDLNQSLKICVVSVDLVEPCVEICLRLEQIKLIEEGL